MSPIRHLIIHHTGADTSTPSSVDSYHRQRFPDAPHPGAQYHYLLGRDGRAYRLQPEGHRPLWHAANADVNASSLAVALVGDLSKGEPPAEQERALVALLAVLCRRFRLDPIESIGGHREVSREPRTCPGSLDLDRVREAVAAAMRGPYHTPAPIYRLRIS